MYIFIGRKFKISAAAFAAVIIFSLSYSLKRIFPLISAALVHELGHIAAMYLCDIKIRSVTFHTSGGDISFDSERCSHIQLVFVYSFGVAFNILCVLLCFALPANELLKDFSVCNIVFAMLNLLPVSNLDGGKILREILYSKLSFSQAQTVSKTVSFVFLFFLWQCGIYFLFKTNANFSLFLMCISLFFEFICDK